MAMPTITVFASRTARHREIGGEIGIARRLAIAFGDRSEHQAGVEHMVVEREIVRRQPVGAKGPLPRPGGGAQPGGGFEQFVFGRLARPEFLERELQFAARPDARESECGNSDDHGLHTPMKGRAGTRHEHTRTTRGRPQDASGQPGHPAGGRYRVGGRSPGSRVNTPVRPSQGRTPPVTLIDRRSPLTVAGAAPALAPRGRTGFPS